MHPIRARVVGGERVLKGSELIHHGAEVSRSELQIHSWHEQLGGVEVPQLLFFGNFLAGVGQQLHQSDRIGARHGNRIEFRFLPNQRRHQIWVQRIL